ncbi:unnamed protein product [Nezara viridula]|uniref:Uncharacterized protein n=1 Tax=Nezara viridula TaxID=85310 RepID=A0A9P0GXV3_NEZVI|nr:unnamed protein product [Nezara viridula]
MYRGRPPQPPHRSVTPLVCHSSSSALVEMWRECVFSTWFASLTDVLHVTKEFYMWTSLVYVLNESFTNECLPIAFVDRQQYKS